jgi:hypothetical protein
MSNNEFVFDFPITMLGARGVGKTSLIAAMSSEFDRVFPDPTLQLIPDEQTGVVLERLLIDLKRVADGVNGYVDPGAMGIQGTMEVEEHRLKMFHTTSSGKLDITFYDYPGGWLMEKPAEVYGMLSGASIILVTLDSPALMKLNDTEHDNFNHPRLVAQALARSLMQARDKERLILFVAMRSEKWLQEGESLDLYRRFEERFADALRTLKGFESDGKVAVAFCPVQTIGSVRFAYYQGEKPIFKQFSGGYRPIDCDQPLRYCMAFMSHQMSQFAREQQDNKMKGLEGRSRVRKAWDWFSGLFGAKSELQQQFEEWQARSKALLQLVQQYGAGCKQQMPFVIQQNRKQLGL